MPPVRSRRAAALLSIAALGGAVAAAPAHAQLGGLLPSVGTIVTDAGQTVTGVVDQTLGGVLGGAGGVLPDNVLDVLLPTLLGNGGAAPGTSGTGAAGVPIVLSPGQIGPGGAILDASAPRPTVKVLSKLKRIGRTGRLRIEIALNEPGIVAVAGRIRPGKAVRAKRRANHSRRLVKVPQIVLGYRRAGRLVVTVKLSRAAQRSLGRARDARMSVATIAVDVFRNQDSDSTKLAIRR